MEDSDDYDNDDFEDFETDGSLTPYKSSTRRSSRKSSLTIGIAETDLDNSYDCKVSTPKSNPRKSDTESKITGSSKSKALSNSEQTNSVQAKYESSITSPSETHLGHIKTYDGKLLKTYNKNIFRANITF